MVNCLSFWLVFMLLFCFGSPASELKEVVLTSCSSVFCAKVKTTKAYRSDMDTAITNFMNGQVEFFASHAVQESDLNRKLRSSLEFTDGYLDDKAEVMVLRGLKSSEHQDALINLALGKITYF